MRKHRGQRPAVNWAVADTGRRAKPEGSAHRALLGSEAAFTLLELTISLAMIGIIVLIILGAMRLGVRSVNSGERRIESLERLRTSMNIVSSQIQSEIPLTWDDDGEKKFYFSGEGESLQFATNYSIWGGQKGYAVVRYTVEPDEKGTYALSAYENVIGMEGSRQTHLFEGLTSISFEYFYKDPTEEQGSWVDEWPDATTTPDKVRLNLVDGDKELAMIIPMRTPGTLTGRRGSAPTVETVAPDQREFVE